MFFADPAKSFANLRKGLKPGGRLAFACWREAKQNPFFILPLREAGKHAPPLPETNPEDPGPFAFASEARVRRILSDAGFADIDLEPHDLELDIAVGRGLDTAVRAAMTIGPTSRMLDGQSEAVRAAATADIRKALAAHARGDSVPLGAAIWIVTATNPGRRRRARCRVRCIEAFRRTLHPPPCPRRNARMRKRRLFGPVGVLRADRTSPTRPASTGHAIPAGRASRWPAQAATS